MPILGIIVAIIFSYVVLKMVEYFEYEVNKKKNAEKKGEKGNSGCIWFWLIAIILAFVIVFLGGC
jgi:phosphate/sulfate permease